MNTGGRGATGTRWVLWAKHEKVKRWVPLLRSEHRQVVVEELIARQDRTRRRKEPVVFKVLAEGESP